MAMGRLSRMFGETVPEPTSYTVSHWSTDPFALGAYSNHGISSVPADRDLLREPVGDRLFFAGEASHKNHPATVHGAYRSGRDAAKRILRLV